MNKQNVFVDTLKFVSIKIVGDFLYFPVWWYGSGLLEQVNRFLERMRGVERRLSLKIWLKNIFVPMYGFYDILSRMISFFMRFFILIFRSIVYLLGLVFNLCLLLFYFLVPIFVLLMFIRSVL